MRNYKMMNVMLEILTFSLHNSSYQRETTLPQIDYFCKIIKTGIQSQKSEQNLSRNALIYIYSNAKFKVTCKALVYQDLFQRETIWNFKHYISHIAFLLKNILKLNDDPEYFGIY